MNRAVGPMYALALIMFATQGASAAGLAASGDASQAKAKLAVIRARIADLTRHLGDELRQRDSANARLREAELRITEQRRGLDLLRATQAVAQRRRTELLDEQLRSQQALELQRRALAGQMRAAYLIGRQEPLRILLNQIYPANFGRALTYYGYFARRRTSQIEAIGLQVGRLQELMTAALQQTEKLRILAEDYRRQISELERARGERSDALGALARQVIRGNQELTQLKREESAIESLVADLAHVLQDFPIDTQQPFERLRGRLPWPVAGHFSAPPAGAQRNGVLIETTRGAKVHAPYFGRVVYADWLQGLGLLLIIGHGGGYLSLYGHTEVLYKSVGDAVAPGDVIAAFGDSAGASSQLYFEIREGRKALDAKRWLKTRP